LFSVVTSDLISCPISSTYLAKVAPKVTLTQHFRSGSKPDDSPAKSISSTNVAEEGNGIEIIELRSGPTLDPIEEEHEIDEDELNQLRANAHLTSMIDFVQAIAFTEQNNSVRSWEAATTAPTLASKFDDILMTSPCSNSTATPCIDFVQAVAFTEQNKRVRSWEAATTAPTLASKLDDILMTSPCLNSTATPCWKSITTRSSNNGVEELLQLFASTPSKTDAMPANLQSDLVGETSPPSLTPKGRQIADDMEKTLLDEPTKLAAVERTCPEWRDNIKFAQLQTDPEHLTMALEAVKKAKSNIQRMRDRILQALMDREQTLELFEQSLERSMERLHTTKK
jgi:hypothetical protein